jgi:hypothetical protein
MFLLLLLEHFKVVVESGIARVPESLELTGPFGNVTQRCRVQGSGTPLGLAAALDETGALQDAKVLGDRGTAHLEGRRDLLDRRRAAGEPMQDRPPVGSARAKNVALRVSVAGFIGLVANQLVI